MSYFILKTIYGAYFIFIAFYGVHLVSMLLFSKLRLTKKLKRFFTGIFISFAWPVMICSSSGLEKLRKSINKF